MDKTIKTKNGGTFTVNGEMFAGYTRAKFRAWIEKYHPEHLESWETLYPGSEQVKEPVKSKKVS